MWTYEQTTGWLFSQSGTHMEPGPGYSGAPEARNDPAKQNLHGIGPIPIGRYKIAAMVAESSHGPYALVLIPDPANEMFGRSGFLIHGDNIHLPGTASHGCIIQSRPVREAVWTSGDHELMVAVEWKPVLS